MHECSKFIFRAVQQFTRAKIRFEWRITKIRSVKKQRKFFPIQKSGEWNTIFIISQRKFSIRKSISLFTFISCSTSFLSLVVVYNLSLKCTREIAVKFKAKSEGQTARSTSNETWPWCLTFTFDLELDFYFAGTLILKFNTTPNSSRLLPAVVNDYFGIL